MAEPTRAQIAARVASATRSRRRAVECALKAVADLEFAADSAASVLPVLSREFRQQASILRAAVERMP